MLTGTQLTADLSSMIGALGLDSAPPDVTPKISQLQVRLPGSAAPKAYPESAYQWLVKVLDGLIDFGQRHGHYGVIKLTKDEYQWLDDILEELIYSVGENQSHPLAPLMDFIFRIIANYEDKYVPKLTERFPELAEEAPIAAADENKKPKKNTPKPDENELAAYAFFSIGYLLYHGNRTEKAISAYDTATALKPDFVEAYHNRGIAMGKLGKSDKAIVDFNKAIALKPDSAELYLNRGVATGNSGQQEEAIADFDKAIELDSKNAKVYYYRGIAKNQLGEYQAAILDFDKAVELGFDSMIVNIYYYRGLAKTLLGQHNAAISDFDKVIALKPDYVQAYNYRGNLRQELGIHGDALADFNKAIHINPDYAEAYNSRGNLNGSLGQYHDALVDCTEAIRIKPDYAEAYAYRGVLEAHLGRINKARSDFQKALELATQQGNIDLKVFVEDRLRQINQVASEQNNKKPRRGGQWEGKMKIAEDFDELPESFMAFFDGEDE